MSTTEQIITIAVMAIAVIATRFLAFLIFTSWARPPHFVRFLGKYLASAVLGMLIIY